jgi:hypothetical protein
VNLALCGSPIKAASKGFASETLVSISKTLVFASETLVFNPKTLALASITLVFNPETLVFASITLVFNPASLDAIPQFTDFDLKSVNNTPFGGGNAPLWN